MILKKFSFIVNIFQYSTRSTQKIHDTREDRTEKLQILRKNIWNAIFKKFPNEEK